MDYNQMNFNQMNMNHVEDNKEPNTSLNIIIYVVLFILISVVIYFTFFTKNNDDVNKDNVPVQNTVSKNVSLLSDSVEIKVNESGKIEYNSYSSDGSEVLLSFVSDNPDVATVDNTGFYLGISPGTANIVVSYQDGEGEKKLNFSITVIKEPEKQEDNTNSKIPTYPSNWPGTGRIPNSGTNIPNNNGNNIPSGNVPSNNGNNIPSSNVPNNIGGSNNQPSSGTSSNDGGEETLEKNFKCVAWDDEGSCKKWERKW